MIKSLNALRFIFIFVIFVHHFGLYSGGGSLGVTFFFLLSGFILAFSYGDKIEKQIISNSQFFIKRFTKIYPLHVALWCVFLVSAIASGYMNFGYILAGVLNLFLLQSWIPITKVCMSYNAVSWFLCDMLFFYAIFPCIIVKLLNNSSQKNVVLLSLIVLLNVLLYILVPSDVVQRTIYVNPLVRLSDFILGILLYDMYKSSKIELYARKLYFRKKWLVDLNEIVVSLSFVLYIIFLSKTPCCRYSIFYWVPISVLILLCTVNERVKNRGVVSKILQHSIWQKLGTISFSFYMLHAMFVKLCQQIAMRFNIDSHSFYVFLCSFMVTLIAAFVCHTYYEVPASRYFMSKFTKKE